MYKFHPLGHLHTLDGQPLIGTTTALGVLAKPLTWWAVGEGLKLLGWTPIRYKGTHKRVPIKERMKTLVPSLNEIIRMKPRDYLTRLDEAYYAHNKVKDSKAEEGTSVHECVEDWIKSVMAGKEIDPDPRIHHFVEWARKNVKQFLWSEVHLYSRELWIGGICDFGYIDMQNRVMMADVKNREKTYLSDMLQMGGYDLQLEENKGGFDAEGNKILTLDRPINGYAIFPMKFFVEPRVTYSKKSKREGFKHALGLHKVALEYAKEQKDGYYEEVFKGGKSAGKPGA